MGLIKNMKKKIKDLDEKRQPKMQEETEVIDTNVDESKTTPAEPKEQPITFGAEAAQMYNIQVQQTALLQQVVETLEKLLEEVKEE